LFFYFIFLTKRLIYFYQIIFIFKSLQCVCFYRADTPKHAAIFSLNCDDYPTAKRLKHKQYKLIFSSVVL